jgi:hypothetical protein
MQPMKTISMTMLGLLLLMGVTVSSRADLSPINQATARMFNGTIDGIDSFQQLVIIQTREEGQEIMRFLAFADPEVMKDLAKGDRVVVEVDQHGLAKKIVKDGSEPKGNPKN